MNNKAILILDDGTIYEGKAAGYVGTSGGEICFNTGMTGYQEVFTDPSYFGQVLVTTNAHIGNYGAFTEESESEKVQIKALVCKNFNEKHSRTKADHNLQDYLEKNEIVCIYDIDTREIVRHIRGKGAMNCIVSTETDDVEALKSQLSKVPSMEGLELASQVTTEEPYYIGDPHAEVNVAVYDFGTKRNILRSLSERGCYLKVYPANTPVEQIEEEFAPDGYFLSNGPGDPAAMDYAIENVKKIYELNKPVFGICLGHQLVALAMGIDTYKMHHGHRGINHPVQNLETGLCEITSQNHGFGVAAASIEQNLDVVDITHKNLNDDTIEGLKVKDKAIFSVQYHPESAPGPHDSRYLFDDFVKNIKTYKNEHYS